MSKAWLDQWFDSDKSSVLRRTVADVEKSNGGGNASAQDLINYLAGRTDGPYSLLEIDGYYVAIRGSDSPNIKVHKGQPSLV